MSSSSTGTFSAPILHAFCQALDIDARRALAACGADPAVLLESEGRVALEVAFRVFDEAPVRAGVKHAGLLAAQRTPPGALDLVDLLARAAPTMGEAFDRLYHYYALIDDRTKVEILSDGSLTRLVLRDRAEIPAPHAAREYLFGVIEDRWRHLTGRALPAVRVCFTSPDPDDPRLYREVFRGAELRFGQPYTELTLEAEGFRAPVRSADPVVLAYLERRAREALERLPRRDAWLDGVRRAVMRALAARRLSLEAMGKFLAMSPRSLQRRLRGAGTSYQELVDSVRCELGIRWVLDDSLPVEQLAERLDFSDATSFHRAFKRWTGDTPRAYRRRVGG